SYLVQPRDTLRFKTFYKIETNWDYAYVEVSTDAVNYTPIPGSITTTYDPYGTNRGNGITGTSVGGWIDGTFDLSAFTGQEIFLRFSYYTDQSSTEEGIYIDDIRPVGVFTVQNVIFPVMDTLSAFTDKPAGLYTYKVRARDAQRQWSIFSNREMTFVKTAYICGNANGDESVNIADAVYIISYVFRGGPAPDPLAAGDANGNGTVNVADAVYLVNYIFRGGPAPVCP
ncbi:MAG: immune inhibitor A, partial [candidate division Zixibacteria bacterium]|nr:immune inhibitor A [candidate division Zixibacteria bacterium]